MKGRMAFIFHVHIMVLQISDASSVMHFSYIMERTYDIVFFKITTLQQSLDASLSSALQRMSNLDLTQIGLPNISGMAKRLAGGLEIFREIGTLRTPKEKLDCLLATISRLTSSAISKDSESITSAKSAGESSFVSTTPSRMCKLTSVVTVRGSPILKFGCSHTPSHHHYHSKPCIQFDRKPYIYEGVCL
jgi:hypothetical protein